MKEVLTFSLISSNQLRTVGNIHTLISMTLMLQTSLLLLKNNFIFQEKVLSYSAPGCVEPRREAEERCRPEAATRMIPASPSHPLRSHLPVILQSFLPLHLHQDPLWEAKQRYFSQDLFLKHHRPRNFNEILVKPSLHAAGSLSPSDSIASNPDLALCWWVVTVKAESVRWSDEKVGPMLANSASNCSIFTAPDK